MDDSALNGPATAALTLTPIGVLRTGQRVQFQARHQPDESARGQKAGEVNVLELLTGLGLEQAVADLAGFDRVWLVWWFHRNTTWRPMVLPPRGPQQRRGVLATRSPHRPNPLGLTPVQLLGVKGRRLLIGPCDLVDGTPIFDIKPYVPAYDSFPEARAGWIEEVDAAVAGPARFSVDLVEPAVTQAAWLRTEWRVDFMPRLRELLEVDPAPHRTRRITRRRGGGFRIGCGAWRAEFRVEGDIVTVTEISPAYPERFLVRTDYTDIPDGDAQRAFLQVWPEASGRGDGECGVG